MSDAVLPRSPKCEHRLQAVLALFRGEPVAKVSKQHRVCRSDLYKFHRRALTALYQALDDQPRGPKRPHNRLDPAREQLIARLCQRHPTWSSYQVYRGLGAAAPTPRTIQRVRRRLGLPRLPKRSSSRGHARCLSAAVKHRAHELIHTKPYLGPERLAWDLRNRWGMVISPSTMKRFKRALLQEQSSPVAPIVWRFYERHHPHSLWHGDYLEKVTLTDLDRTAYQLTLMDDYSRGYVFCDLFLYPDVRTTIHALIAAMRQWQVIPKAVVFDNAQQFRGKLLSAFCEHLGIRLIHCAVNHPQTNGKLERAFRDDMQEFYRQYGEWILAPLRRDLPDYVHYRNAVRGHRALGGKPSITRLYEHGRVAAPEVLDRLESYACYEVKRKVVSPYGNIPLFSRDAYVGTTLAGIEVAFMESLEGLEARVEGQCVAILKDYWTIRKLSSWEREHLPPILYFEKYERTLCPRMAVAP